MSAQQVESLHKSAASELDNYELGRYTAFRELGFEHFPSFHLARSRHASVATCREYLKAGATHDQAFRILY